jgi:membrane-bound ClpP family serine protease
MALLLLGALVRWEYLSLPLAAGLLAAFVAKDFALYPLVRVAYEPSRSDGAGSLVGALGTVKGRLDPEGWVRVGSELWRARVDAAHAPIEAGAAVRVIDVRSLTLWVEPV